MSSKSLAIFEKPQISYYSLHFSENVFKKPHNFYKSLTLSLTMSRNSFNIIKNASYSTEKSLNFFLNASIPLKMYLKSLAILEKA
jgi:hypothetical protein